MSFTMVYYFVPEDGEASDEWNAFGINKGLSGLTQGDIRKAFPLPGKYHFRFKNMLEGKTAWMDLNGDHCVALAFQGKIVMKVTRICWEGKVEQRDDGIREERKENSVKGEGESVKSFDLLFND